MSVQAVFLCICSFLIRGLAATPVGVDETTTTMDVDVAIIGAGYAGLASAKRLLDRGNLSLVVLEAQNRVGGRVRNFDLGAKHFDVASDSSIEVGGTFVSPGHTALIRLARAVGVEVFNVSRPSLRQLPPRGLSEPPDAWPWWYWGVDTRQALPEKSVFHTMNNGTHTFSTPQELVGLLPTDVVAELQRAGKALFDAADQIKCEQATDGGSWFAQDSQTFEGWLQKYVSHEEGRYMLRAMTRGMIAQEPADVSFLSIVKSMKGCWSSGDDDQYRLRGGSQAPLLKIATSLGSRILLSSPVRRVVSTTSQGFELHSDRAIVRAKHVVLTGPPPTISKIEFDPPLAADRAQLLQRMPMGTSLKYFLVYERKWWHSVNMSGLIMSSRPTKAGDLFDCCQEHSPFDEAKYPVLMCWIEGETNLRFLELNESQRLEHVQNFLADSFAGTILPDKPTQVIAFNWADAPWERGAYTGYFAPGVQSQPAMWSAYSQSEWLPGMYLAGADWFAGYGNGYMEGAVRSGETAADKILEA